MSAKQVERASIAVIGLGNMGTPMSARLVAAGHEVRGFDPAPAARVRASEGGVTVHESAAAAVSGADVVILMLPNSDIVESVVTELRAAQALSAGALLIDMSSSDPLRTRGLGSSLASHGITFVDAPVSGGVKGAVAGTLTIMVGGEDDAASLALELLAPLGRTVHCGGIGAGHAVKALNNLLSATHLWVTSEAIETGKAFGLDPEVMLQVFNTSSGQSGSTTNKWPNFILPGTFNSGFGLQLMLKDMKIAVSLANELGVPANLGEDAVALWSRAANELAATADHTEVASWIHHDGEQRA